MIKHHYDALVVGARCAGSPTAMLLARKGYKVLVVDRATFPSDTISTHLIHPLGVATLNTWGLLDRLVATGCPPIDTYAFDFGPVTISGVPGTAEAPVAYSPRWTVLDKLLVEAGAEVSSTLLSVSYGQAFRYSVAGELMHTPHGFSHKNGYLFKAVF